MTAMMNEALRVSRILSWNTPNKKYYSVGSEVSCPACKNEVNLGDLIEKRGTITCRKCK